MNLFNNYKKRCLGINNPCTSGDETAWGSLRALPASRPSSPIGSVSRHAVHGMHSQTSSPPVQAYKSQMRLCVRLMLAVPPARSLSVSLLLYHLRQCTLRVAEMATEMVCAVWL